MLLALLVGVPVRIVHSHNDLRWLRRQEGRARRAYYWMLGPFVRSCSSAGLAASRLAAEDYYGARWEPSGKFRVLYCGVDLNPFRVRYEPDAVRKELGIASDAFVVGHVGRFTLQKNHPFMFEILHAALQREPRTRLVLAGDGLLESESRVQARRMKLEDKVLFLGSRADVPRLLLGCMDVFLFPSLFEGLGLALIEAQAAGLPCVVSNVIPPEADVVAPLITRLFLSQPADVWADALLATRSASPPVSQTKALSAVIDSPFNIDRAVKTLEEFYESCDSSRGSRKWARTG
jgi:glycosyltransferase involved in cell wall biosynthesis